MGFDFKCAESQDHIDAVDISVEDIHNVYEFIVHFDIPTKWTAKTLYNDPRMMGRNTRHDLAHILLEDIIVACNNGHPAVTDEMFEHVLKELKIKQEECKIGTPHKGGSNE